jgi:RNA polymerase sigma-54 factor
MSQHPQIRTALGAAQRQIMTFALHQALRILQMPQLELAEWIQTEIERNPVLEPTERPCPTLKSPAIELLIAAKPTLREHLLRQSREMFMDTMDRQTAEWLIDQLDDRGWFTASADEQPSDRESVNRILLVIQTFDPPGIGARSLQECLWLQLRAQSYSLAEILVRDHFDDLIQGRFAAIQKRLHISYSDLQKALHRIARLRLRATSGFDDSTNQFIVPDIILKEIDSCWILEVGAQELPVIKLQNEYIDLIPALKVKEEKSQLRGWVTSARWLQRCIRRRHNFLRSIGHLLIRTQQSFLSHTGKIEPLEIGKLAEILNVHPSTAWRAVAGKTLACSRGLFALRQFFSEAAAAEPIKEQIRRLIQAEDRSHPLSDEAIMKKLQKMGIRCARRTVSKYRRSLQIRAAARRYTAQI